MKEHVANILKQMGEYDMTRRQNRGGKKQKKKEKSYVMVGLSILFYFYFSFCFDKHLSFLTYDVKIIVNQGEVD